MAPRKTRAGPDPAKAAADLDNILDQWPKLEDMGDMGDIEVIRTDFSLEDHLRTRMNLVNNPWVPPKGCPINDLPNELLSHIFHLGTLAEEEDVDEDVDEDGTEYGEYAMDDEDNYSLGHDFDMGDPDSEAETNEDQIQTTPISQTRNPIIYEDGDEDEDHDYDDEPPTLPFQVLVSHVCSHWRSVAIEAPSLWRQIRFTQAPPFSKAAAYIARSKGISLDIVLDCTPEDDDLHYSLDDLHEMLKLVIPHAARWRCLEVNVENYTYMYAVLQALHSVSAAPLLEALELYHHDMTDEEATEFEPKELNTRFILFSNNAPRLQHIALWGTHIDWANSTILAGLLDLELAYHVGDVRPSWADFARMLRASPQLETLTLSASGPAGEPTTWEDDGPVELPGLAGLVLAYHEPEYIGPLVQRLELPSITALTVDFDSSDFTDFVQQLATPQKGKGKSLFARLKYLKLSGLPCNLASMDMMYEQLGGLQSINLGCNFLDEVFFERLTKPIPASTSTSGSASTSTAFYCPLLENVTVSGIGGRDIRRLVEVRKAAGIPIKRVMMSEDDDLSERDEEWFNEALESFETFSPSDEEDDDDDGLIEIDESDLD
ncbi:hypothetical protein PLICRDRAFT_324778 [Plicaturopsis crispa FD-325 SS-3]|nr:hypothetical protein PLICRDRAFT_324778 [Plicaturopsis crispa FD-325 SS-3]